ncbi:MAG TPA: cation:proton antiporter [Bacteroidales bacterium]|jgi:multicomponent Na+:H+ antiporter subunit F|nr:cation:proton antiporter [Bacteroidales bacterium]
MVNLILNSALILVALSMLLAFIRFLIGPDTVNRLVSFDVVTISSIALIGLISYTSGRIIYLDIALVYGLLSFLGIIIVAKYLEKGL